MGQFQFSLRLLLAAVAVVSATGAVLIAEPTWQAGLALLFLSMLYPAVFLAGVLTADRTRRAICIGALIPALVSLTLVVAHVSAFLFKFQINSTEIEHLRSLLEEVARRYRLIACTFWASMLLFGAACGLLERIFFSSGRS